MEQERKERKERPTSKAADKMVSFLDFASRISLVNGQKILKKRWTHFQHSISSLILIHLCMANAGGTVDNAQSHMDACGAIGTAVLVSSSLPRSSVTFATPSHTHTHPHIITSTSINTNATTLNRCKEASMLHVSDLPRRPELVARRDVQQLPLELSAPGGGAL